MTRAAGRDNARTCRRPCAPDAQHLSFGPLDQSRECEDDAMETLEARLYWWEARVKGSSPARIERVITGHAAGGDEWLVVLYRHEYVEGGRQLVGYRRPVRASAVPVDRLAQLIWLDEIEEPPGDCLPQSQLNPAGIAWWGALNDWAWADEA
jgi:hypothetical protein